MRRDVRTPLLLVLAALALAAAAPSFASAPAQTQVVVTLEAPALAQAVQTSRVLSSAAKRRRLDLGSATSRGYLGGARRASG